MLGLLQCQALRIERILGLRMRLQSSFDPLLCRFHDLLMADQAGFRRSQAGTLSVLLTGDFVQYQPDLPAALLEALQSLGQPEVLHLLFMHLLLQSPGFLPQRRQAPVMAAERRLDHVLFGARLTQGLFAVPQLGAQVLDFALAREYAGISRVGRMEADRAARKLMPLATDHDYAGRQRLPVCRAGHALHRIYPVQPILHHPAYRLVVNPEQGCQRPHALQRQLLCRPRRRIHAQFCRRRIFQHALQQFRLRHFHRVQLFAQYRLERGFPSGLDAYLPPQTRQGFQPVPDQPFVDLGIALDLVLHLLQRCQARFEPGLFPLLRIEFFLGRPARVLQLRQLLQLQSKLGILARQLFGQLRNLALLFFDRSRIRFGQALVFGNQALLPRIQAVQGLGCMADMRLLDSQRLLALGQGSALFGQPRLHRAECLIGLRQPDRFLRNALVCLLQPLSGPTLAPLPQRERSVQLARLLLPLLALRGELRCLVLQAGPALADIADLGFQALHFGVGGVQIALRGAERVARFVVRAAHFFQAFLDLAQARGFGFQLVRRPVDFARMALRLVIGFHLAQQPQQVLLALHVALQFLELQGYLGLLVELVDLQRQLLADVGYPRQILARIVQPVLGLAAPLLVPGNACRLLQEHAQLFRLGLDDARNHALFDDGVGARPQARAHENILDVAPAHVAVVDVVQRFAFARQHALHRDFRILRPLARGLAQAVVESQFHAGAAHRFSLRRAVEDHVLHRIAAQGRGTRLAQYPAHGVDHVGFAAAVRADYADELARHGDGGRIDEGLESG